MYSQQEIINILCMCDSASELLYVRCLLEDFGNSLQDVAMDVYNFYMEKFLTQNKIDF